MDKKPRIFTVSFGSVYPLYVQKAAKKRRTKEEVDEIITWLTGYSGGFSCREFMGRLLDFDPPTCPGSDSALPKKIPNRISCGIDVVPRKFQQHKRCEDRDHRFPRASQHTAGPVAFAEATIRLARNRAIHQNLGQQLWCGPDDAAGGEQANGDRRDRKQRQQLEAIVVEISGP